MKIDLINFLVIILMALSLIAFMFYYNYSLVNECTSNPLVFGAKQMEDRSGYEFYGTGYFKAKEGTFIHSTMITFNSTHSKLQQPS